jgi:peroxiredoxin
MLPLLSACVPNLVSPDLGEDSDVPWTAPDNSWFQGQVPSDLEAEGFGVGQVPPDFRLVDQHGDTVSLWQFHGQIIVLDISTMWCSPCRELAEEAQETRDHYQEHGFEYVTLLAEDVEGADPDGTDLQAWVEYYGLEMPVVADPGKVYTSGIVTNGQYPALRVIDRTMRVHASVVTPTDAALRAAVDELL